MLQLREVGGASADDAHRLPEGTQLTLQLIAFSCRLGCSPTEQQVPNHRSQPPRHKF